MIKKQITLISLIILITTSTAFAKESLLTDLKKAPTNKVLSVLKDKLSSQKNKEKNISLAKEYFDILQKEQLLNKIDSNYKKFMGNSWMSYGNSEILEDVNKIKDPKVVKALKEGFSLGYKIVTPEGSAMFVPDYDKLVKFLSPYLPQNELEYFKLSGKSSEVAEDGGLVISFDELFTLIADIESLINKIDKKELYKDETIEMKETINSLIQYYFRGMDNTPVFDYEKNKIVNKEVLDSYKKNLKKYSNTKAGKNLKAYYDLLNKTKFVKNKDIEKFLDTNKLYK